MSKRLRVLSLGFAFADGSVVCDSLETERALFDFDVVAVRPPRLEDTNNLGYFQRLSSLMKTKRRELDSLFAQGGILIVFLDAPSYCRCVYQGQTYSVSNYEFIDSRLAPCLQKGTGTQLTYGNTSEPFVGVLKKSTVEWTTYIAKEPKDAPLSALRFFARAGSAGALAGKMPFGEGHVILLPNVNRLDEQSFLEACAEYRFKRQGTPPPEWTSSVFVPGLAPIESEIAGLEKQIAELRGALELRQVDLEERSAYRKLLYEKGKTQLEPIVLRALDDLEFDTSPGEIIKGTGHEIDGRTSKGSMPGIVEVKGSKNQIVQSEFSPFVTKILADSDVSNTFSKGILVGNGLCENEPNGRLGDAVFSAHVLDGARRHSVALVNSVELYWLCCALLRGDVVDKNAVREAILGSNGYVDLRPFCGGPPFTP